MLFFLAKTTHALPVMDAHLCVKPDFDYLPRLDYIVTVSKFGQAFRFTFIEAVTVHVVIKTYYIAFDETSSQVSVNLPCAGDDI